MVSYSYIKLMDADTMIPQKAVMIGLFLADTHTARHTSVYHFLDLKVHSLLENEINDKITSA